MAKPRIVLIIARGEAVRNFLYSDTLKTLASRASVTLLSVVHDQEFRLRFGALVEEIVPLETFQENKFVLVLRDLILHAHYRWIWTARIKNKWENLAYDANTPAKRIKFQLWKALVYVLANRPMLDLLAWIENRLSLLFKPTDMFDRLFERTRPDLVFNCSHIHAPAAELPVRVAHQQGIHTAAFIFSWDNLSTRGRILPPYDDYFVWHAGMRQELLAVYPAIKPEHVFITGTPQFDFHFQPAFCLPRAELCRKLGLDPRRPFILYTTGMAEAFPEEHRFVQAIIAILQEMEPAHRPLLVVRMYIKGIGAEMLKLSQQKIPDVIFPPVLWEEKWFTPRFEDMAIYSSLLQHAQFGINPASTVTLELLMLGKPVINLGFDPPGSALPHYLRWHRHLEYDHFRPIVESGATKVAYSLSDLRLFIQTALTNPDEQREQGKKFIEATFGDTLGGASGRRVAEQMLKFAVATSTKK